MSGGWELAHTADLDDDPVQAVTALAEAEAARSPSMELFNSWIDVAPPWVRAVDGDLPGAVAAALDGAARAQDAGLVGFEVVSLHDAVRLGAADDVVVPLRAAASQIAEELVTSVRTVDNHLHRVYAKLGVEDRGQLRSVLGSDR